MKDLSSDMCNPRHDEDQACSCTALIGDFSQTPAGHGYLCVIVYQKSRAVEGPFGRAVF